MVYRSLIFLSALALLFSAAALSAEEIEYPVAAYSKAELAKVRAWEKTWVGKKIDSANVNQVKEFLPQTMIDLMTDVDRWGESYFKIGPYQQIKPTPGRVAMTKKYYGQPKIGPNRELLNYTSGVPFPFAKTGTQMAHNFRNRTYGDGYTSIDDGYIVDGRLKYDMVSKLKNNIGFFSGRTDVEPIPEAPKNPKQIWRAFTAVYLKPPESRNLRIMEITYKDRMKPYDSWMWFPTIRRIRRRSTTERQDANGGADYCGFDNFGWDGPIQINTYKFLGQKELLMVRHNDRAILEHEPGDCLYDNAVRERCKVNVIEVENEDDNFMYSKMTWYVDPECWMILYLENYDRHGKLWKVIDQYVWVDPETGVNDMVAGQTVDVQRIHSTLANSTKEYGPKFNPRQFSLQWMQKRAY